MTDCDCAEDFTCAEHRPVNFIFDRPCPSCSHRAHIGACTARNGRTAYACMCLQAPAVAPAVPRGVAGDRCGPGNECGRLGCEECQQ